ncbi:MAG: DEAD/DEAH box helicase [Treponema sp.]|nr:DEAD/DEAH box helicase [Treponema sp.]
MLYPEEIKSLPITEHLDEICERLKASPSHFLVLTAETAAGKSTAIPLALLKHFDKKIIMLEPRRLAVVAIANRIASLLDEDCGKTAGYRLHLENKISKETRLEIITEAILTRKLQNDMSLEDVSVVVIDEYHERSIHADLALAFLKEVMELRDDLYVIVMSATIDTTRLSKYLGNAEVYNVKGRQFPVKIEYKGNISPSQAVKQELAISKDKGSILVFLPGLKEILKTKEELENVNAEILTLHSSISMDMQKKVLSKKNNENIRRVILSSAIAETSITVPDVDTVIDCGLSRMNILNIATGMEHLTTVTESIFSASQRAGRAGRIKEGRCIRLWNENDIRNTSPLPEIQRSDLTSLVLECSLWGTSESDGLSWLDVPSKASWQASQSLLKNMGCLDSENKITEAGKAVLKLGESTRLACIALAGIDNKRIDEAINIITKYSNYKNAENILKNRIEKLGKAKDGKWLKDDYSSLYLAGFPDRLGVLTEDKGKYRFYSGRQASLTLKDKQRFSVFPKYIIAIEVDAGESEGIIQKWDNITDKEAEAFLYKHSEKHTEVSFSEDNKNAHKLKKEEITSYGKIILSIKKLPAETSDYKEAVFSSVKKNGIKWLPLSDASKSLILRAKFLSNTEISIAKSIKAKLENIESRIEEWLSPFITENNISEKMVYDALCYYFNSIEIDKNAPKELILPNGKKRKLSYEERGNEIIVALEVIIQQIFGCMAMPKIAGKNILLRLLSPARRPLQVTDNLESFWINTWPEICKEMKGRYPKHNWDYRLVEKD